MAKPMKINRRLLDPDDPRKVVQSKAYVDTKRGERWEKLPGYENILVSNLGRVQVDNKLKKQSLDKDGYYRVGIGNGIKSKQPVHRLVAKTFIPNPDNLPVVDHINGSKTDNRACNLRWCTVAQNTQWAYDLGTLTANGNTMMALALNVETREAKIYPSQAEMGRQLGITSSEIAAAIDGKYKHACHGYKFFRLKDIDLADLFGDEYCGTTVDGGVWAEHGENGIRVRVVDNRDNPMTQASIKKLVSKIHDKIVRGEE